MAFLVRQPNSRQIPKHIDYTAYPLYNDLIYGYLQSVSILDTDNDRYVAANLATRAVISRELNMSPPTVRKYFEGMQELMLIGPKEKGRYKLYFIAEDYAYLIPQNILELIVKQQEPRVLSIYIYFLMRSYYDNKVPYSLTAVKNFVGLSINTADNGHIITEALDILQSLGLLLHGQSTSMKDGKWKSEKYVMGVKNVL